MPRIRLLLLAALAGALSLFATAPTAGAETVRLHAVMTPSQETPPTASPGIGDATVLFPGGNTVCVVLRVTRTTGPVTGAHIHQAPAGVPGPVVIPLTPPRNGFSFTCRTVATGLINELRSNPSAFYANVHTPTYPLGELRGQLAAA
jgi:hypothetical protein